MVLINVTAIVFVGYLRLGSMARDRGQIYEASDWFKEALQINQVLISDDIKFDCEPLVMGWGLIYLHCYYPK